MTSNQPDTDAPVIHFDQLLARCMGNLEFAERILNRFQQRFGEDLDQIESGLSSHDSEEIARIAHSLKGASATVAAPALESEMARIESLARKGELEDVPNRLDQVRVEWSRFVDSASAYAPSTPDSSPKGPSRQPDGP